MTYIIDRDWPAKESYFIWIEVDLELAVGWQAVPYRVRIEFPNTGLSVSESFISVRCPRCNALASVNSDQAGEMVICRKCEQEMLVSGKAKTPEGNSVDDLLSIDDDRPAPEPHPSVVNVKSSGTTKGKETADTTEQDPNSGTNSGKADEGLPELTDWSNYRRSNPRAKGADTPADHAVESKANPSPESESGDDDMDDLLMTVTQPPEESEVTAGADPFEVDKFAALKVDGITPADSEFPITCNVCGSLMYGRLSQVGSKIKCHDCYSMVTVPAPRKVPDNKGKPKIPEAKHPEYDENEGYRLEPESKLAPLDTTIDLSLGEIDYDDDDFFAKRREMESAEPEIFDDPGTESGGTEAGGREEPAPGKSVADGIFEDSSDDLDNDDDYGLAPVEDGKLPRKSAQTVFESIDDLLDAYPAPKAKAVEKVDPATDKERPINVVPVEEPTDARERTVEPKPEQHGKGRDESKQKAEKTGKKGTDKKGTDKKKSGGGGIDDAPSPFAGLGGWIGNAISIVLQPMNLARIGMGTVILGFGYLLFFGGLSIFDPDNEAETINKFGGYLLMGLGVIPIVLTFFMLAVHSSSIIRDAIEQRSSKGEWPDFSIADFFSQFLYVGTSFWLAAVPGIIVGQILWIATDFFYFLPGCLMASSVLLAPFFLSSVVFNDSPLALVSGDAFVSISKFRNRWIRYWIGSLLISITFVAALAGAALGTVFAFLFPMIQLVLALMLFWMVGDLTGYIVRFMEQKGAATT